MADQKIWFVHDGKAKTGPISQDELQARFERGEVSLAHYLWKDGMSGWKKAADLDVLSPAGGPPDFVPEFETPPLIEAKTRFLEAPPATPGRPVGPAEARPMGRTISSVAATASSAGGSGDGSRTGDDLSALIEVPATKDAAENTGLLDLGQLRNARREAANAVRISQSQQRSAPTPQFSRRFSELGFMPRLMICLTVVGALGGVGWFMLPDSFTSPLSGSLQKAFSPIPTIKDVTASEYAALSAVAEAGPEQGVRADFALSQTDPETPTFYVATNQPSGTQLMLLIDPKEGTLVADAPNTIQVTLSVNEKLGKTAQIKTKDGGILPMGEYKIDLKDKENRVLTSHAYFLGGQQDASYQGKLNDYLNSRRSRGQAEIALYLAIDEKLDALLAQERKTAPGIARLDAASRARAWSDYDSQWNAAVAGIDHDLQAKASVFTKLYRSTQDARNSLAAVHAGYKYQVDNGGAASRAPASGTPAPDLNQLNAVLSRDIADSRERAGAAAKAASNTGFIKED